MKKIVLFSLCFSALNIYAQGIKLETGKKITSSANTTMDMDMGVAGQMKIASTTTNIIEITGVDDKNYTAKNTTTKMTMTQEGMGQSVNFDSEKKEDRETEMGKEMSKMIDVASEIMIEKASGKVKEKNKPAVVEDDTNPMAGIMSGGATQTAEASAAAAFFTIPAGKKVGDKWADSVTEAGMKGLKNYEIKSINGDVATVAYNVKSNGTISKEVQGMQLEVTMDATGVGTLLVDTKTSLVKKSTLNNDVNGNLDMMGQSMPLTMKMSSVIDFQ